MTRKIPALIGVVTMTAGLLACSHENPSTPPPAQAPVASPTISAVPTSPTPPEVPAPTAQPSAATPETALAPTAAPGSDAKAVMKMMEAPTTPPAQLPAMTQPSSPPSTMPDGGY